MERLQDGGGRRGGELDMQQTRTVELGAQESVVSKLLVAWLLSRHATPIQVFVFDE